MLALDDSPAAPAVPALTAEWAGYAPFSVLVSTYAGERAEFLALALASVLRQTLPAAEIVLVVDGPVDAEQEAVITRCAADAAVSGTAFVVERRAACGGLTAALNAGLARCRQPWVARMDSDDFAPPERFAVQWAFLRDHPAVDFLAGQQAEFSDHPSRVERVKDVPETHDAIVRVLRWRNTISHPSLVVRTRCLRDVGGYHEVRYLEDYDLYVRLAAAGARFHGLQRPTAYVRVTDAQRVRRGGLRYAVDELRFRTTLLRRGHISVGTYVASAPAYFAYRLCPAPVKRAAYRLVRPPPTA